MATKARKGRAIVRAKAKAPKSAKTRSRAVVRRKAATLEVIGKITPPVRRVPTKWREPYQRLVRLHEVLLRRRSDQARTAKEEKPTFSLHMADAGTDNYDQDFALSMISSEQNALYEIEEAIKRIHDGTYGVCQSTGKPIEPERLNAIPWARFSAPAEQQLEREGAVARTQLGRREEVPKSEALPEETEEGDI